MTEQNNLARELPEVSENEDPLEELARIVSGGIDLDAVRKDAEEQDEAELEPEIAQQTVEVMAYDLESELMRELGTERFQENAAAEENTPADDLDDMAEFGQFDHPVRSGSIEEPQASAKPQPVVETVATEDTDLDVTLEDQLMAELDPDDLAPEATQADELQPPLDAAAEDQQRANTDQTATPPATNRRDTSFANLLPSKSDKKQIVEDTEIAARDVQADQNAEIDPGQGEAEEFDFESALAAEIQAEAAAPQGPGPASQQEPDHVQQAEPVAETPAQKNQAGVDAQLQASYDNSEADQVEDHSDLSAAFEAELSQLGLENQQDELAPELAPEPEPQPSPEPVAAIAASDASTAAAANKITSRPPPIPAKADLDDEFARAFAKELDLGSLSSPKAQPQKNPVPAQVHAEKTSHAVPEEAPANWGGISNDDALPEFDMPDAFDDASVNTHDDFPTAEDLAQDDVLYEENEADHYQAENQQGDKRRGGFKLAAGALALALLVGGGAVAYSYFSGSASVTAPVTIKADSEPVKVKPADPGGTTVANQDKAAYERVTGDFATETRQETLVKSTETPVDVPGRDVEQTNSTTLASALNANKEENRLSPDSTTREFNAAPVLEPRRVKTVTVNPDGTVVKPQTALSLQAAPTVADTNSIGGAVTTGQIGVPAARPSASEQTSPVTANSDGTAPIPLAPNPVESRLSASPFPKEGSVASAPVASSSSEPASAVSTQSATQDEPVSIASTTPAPPQPVVSSTSSDAASAGNWAVQISSQRSAEDAQTTYQKMREQYSDVIGNQQMSIQRAEIEGKGVFFRVRVMAQTRQEALDICSKLKSAGGSCFVTQ